MMEEDGIGKVEMAQTSTSNNQNQNQNKSKFGRKGMGGMKAWMVVSERGEVRLEEVEKQYIMRRTGLPARDLRVLDPMLSHPSSILGRERAIVVNLEHIKAIITAREVLIINSSNPLFIRFLQDLLSRIPSSNHPTPPRMSNETYSCYEVNNPVSGGRVVSSSPNYSLRSNSSDDRNTNSSSPRMLEGSSDDAAFPACGDTNSNSNDTKCGTTPNNIPFEFRALEACLDSACRCLESETRTLEEEAYPALDELTSQISTLNLERVRQIKSRLVTLSGRVQKVKDQLEHLLDDDNDMAEMYLTHKLGARLTYHASLRQAGFSPIFEDHDDQRDDLNSSKSDSFSDPKLDVEELEMLLEAYFAQINGSLQKLSSLSEYVDDTEDCINISLDDKRNQLLQVAVIFDTLNMILSAGIVVVGLFGMNIHIDLFDGQPHQFWETIAGTLAGCIALFLLSVWWCKKKYLLPA